MAQPNCGVVSAAVAAAIKVKTGGYIKNFGMAKLFGLLYTKICSGNI